MTINKQVTIVRDVEIYVGVEDIRRAFAETFSKTNSPSQMLHALNQCAEFIRAVDVAQLNSAQRGVCAQFFAEQMDRFEVRPDAGKDQVG